MSRIVFTAVVDEALSQATRCWVIVSPVVGGGGGGRDNAPALPRWNAYLKGSQIRPHLFDTKGDAQAAADDLASYLTDRRRMSTGRVIPRKVRR